MTPETLFTPSGVRLRLRVRREGTLNWLLLPGGPGIGSQSLHELADAIDVPGAVWMVDLPGDGSNPSSDNDPYRQWPQVLIEAAEALPNRVYVGHSTGGMYLLSTPELESRIVGLALLSTAPDASWRSHYVATTLQQPLRAFDAALAVYEREPTVANLRDLAVASAEWNFAPASLAAGRDLLSRMPYNTAAVVWSDVNFDNDYVSVWWPETIPTLILAGDNDRIVGQHGWDQSRFEGANVTRVAAKGGGHFPWIDNPQAVRDAFTTLAESVRDYRAR